MTLINTQSYWLGAPIQVTDSPNRTPREQHQFIHSFFICQTRLSTYPHTSYILGSEVSAGYTGASKEAKVLLTPRSQRCRKPHMPYPLDFSMDWGINPFSATRSYHKVLWATRSNANSLCRLKGSPGHSWQTNQGGCPYLATYDF